MVFLDTCRHRCTYTGPQKNHSAATANGMVHHLTHSTRTNYLYPKVIGDIVIIATLFKHFVYSTNKIFGSRRFESRTRTALFSMAALYVISSQKLSAQVGFEMGSATDGRTVTSGQGLMVHSDYQNKGVRYRIRNYAIRESLKGVPIIIVKFVDGVTRTTEAAGIKAKKRTCSDHHHERCKLFVMFFLPFAMFSCYQPFCRPLIIGKIYDLQNFHIILLLVSLLLVASVKHEPNFKQQTFCHLPAGNMNRNNTGSSRQTTEWWEFQTWKQWVWRLMHAV